MSVTKARVISGARWVIAGTLLRNLMLFGIMVALARLLPPSDFGLIAMLGLFVGISAALTDSGLGAALIQAKRPTDVDKSTLFWTQLSLSIVLGGALAAAGPWLAALFEQPVLVGLAAAYGFNTVIGSLISIQRAMFAKELDFKPVTEGQVAAELISGGAAITAALFGAGVWSLYLQSLARATMISALLWYFSPWRPGLVYSFVSLQKYLGFGLYQVGCAVLSEVESRVGAFFLGQVSTPTATGYFQRSAGTTQQLAKNMRGAVARVAFPTFSALQDDHEKFLSALRQAVFINVCVSSMFMWTLAIAAEPAVGLVFGEGWLPMVPALQAFCVAAGVLPYYSLFARALRAIGRVRVVFWQYFLRAGGAALISLMMADKGFDMLAWSLTILLIALSPIYILTAVRYFGYRLGTQFRDLVPILTAGGAMYMVASASDSLVMSISAPMQLLALTLLGLTTFTIVTLVWAMATPMRIGRKSFATMRDLVRRKNKD